ncbi:phosphate ABC transporter substrate-binding/OmpA family protein [Candidatus Phycosocius spiralis]|uniref:OmpA-like domain-containing protein n=1 Tax=Candidatus Phycosocius spiralis TaxID=2815099 RepID=A0ABQ4PTH2_9PROT|nr:phosphate ABC transporter substrate-binding/OmpA family protein [Candidatus Phycosocius spiralis]GIU66282.1 hypothetical protein PsB1_0436 [Candidatus Phycosocius spiralis]
MADGRDDVPYDWEQAFNPKSAKSRTPRQRSKPMATSGKLVATAPKKANKITVTDLLLLLSSVVIVVGLIALFWMSWIFQAESQHLKSAEQGQIPSNANFSAGQNRAPDVLFRLGGAAIMGSDIMMDLVSAWMRQRGYTSVRGEKTDQMIEVRGFRNGDVGRVLIALASSQGGFEALTQQRVEAVMSVRSIQPGEADRLSALGNLTSAASERVIGLTTSLVIVNRGNPINKMDVETLSRILAGEITDWKQVTKNWQGPIVIKLEDTGPDFASSVAGRLLGDREPPDNTAFFTDQSGVAEAVGLDTYAIGITQHESGNAKSLAINERGARSVGADDFSISTETYPFTQRLYLYVGSSGADPEARDFADFAISPTGQDLVARLGFTPMKVRAVKVLAPTDASKDYRAFGRFAERMNFDIRFYEGANELDSRAVEDLKRFVDFVRRNQIDKRRIALLGFADNVGTRTINIGLAQSRAETVALALQGLGVTPGLVRSYGDSLPVGFNGDERGRVRNRRVEVWLCAPPACPLINLGSQAVSQEREIPAGVRLGPPKPVGEGEPAPKG